MCDRKSSNWRVPYFYMKQAFDKLPTTHRQQIALLQSRGMLVDDVEQAGQRLKHLNYYRLSAYWLPFEADHNNHQFQKNVRFRDVLDLYAFDRELRLLVLDGIESIEVSVRSQLAYI